MPGLPIEYFREDIIKLILDHVGTPLRLDHSIASMERGRFLLAAVEIDLTKPLVSMVRMRGLIQNVKFEIVGKLH